MSILLKGADVASAMKEKMSAEVAALNAKGITPTLGIVRVGEREDDLAYERGVIKRFEGLGTAVKVFAFDANISTEDLLCNIESINADMDIHGILIFRPLPRHIDENRVRLTLSPTKDLDGVTPTNLAKIFEGDATGFAPCTAEAVVKLLNHYEIPLCGSNISLIGRSLVVGKPLAMLLLQENATVTMCHTRTVNLPEICRASDIIIAAAGSAEMVTSDFCRAGQVVIDVGINFKDNGQMCGDVNFAGVEGIVEKITPVPGGVGSVTTSVLAEHLIRAAKTLDLRG